MKYWVEDNLGWVFLIGGALAIVALFAGTNYMAARSCRIYQETTEHETKYRAFDECYVKRDSRWWRWDEYKLAYATTAQDVQP